MRAHLACLIAAAVLATGCSAVGPQTIPRDRSDYIEGISESWKHQMLINLVKTRYSDVPVFLDITSAISSYTFETSVTATGTVSLPGAALENDSASVGARGAFTDRPTITYNPLTGDKFAKSLMTPIPPTALLSLIQAGWSPRLLLRCCVHSVNGLRNYSQRGAVSQPVDPGFVQLLDAVERIQRAGGLGMRLVREKDGSGTLLSLHPGPSGQLAADVAEARRLLGLAPENEDLSVTYGIRPADDQEIALLTRSMLEILLDMSSYIEVPASHVAENRAGRGFDDVGAAATGIDRLIRVHSSKEAPADAFIAVKYRDHWFWIDDRDFQSKGVFTFLMFLFTLTETGGGQTAPVITVPAG
ncbi:MAG: hypothetical protein MUC71_01820 [Steroidobacteraceae bacterium]|jgi:hypothetical protein|nr:hypothetical protein [Steroidobacteraceae bacterium]